LMRVVGRLGWPRWLKAVGNDIKCPGMDECAYTKLPSRSAWQLALLLRAVRADLPSVRCPALVFSSVGDHVVPPKNQQELFASIASPDKQLVPLPNSFHVATMDCDKEEIFSRTLEFIATRSR
jgi:carboxylesterase